MKLEDISAMTAAEREAFASRIEMEMLSTRTSDYSKSVPAPRKARGRAPRTGSLIPPAPPAEVAEEETFVPARRVRKARRHGTVSGYNAGCGCAPCRQAKAAYQAGNSAKLAVERAAPFRPIKRTPPVSMPFERSKITSIDAARDRAGEAS